MTTLTETDLSRSFELMTGYVGIQALAILTFFALTRRPAAPGKLLLIQIGAYTSMWLSIGAFGAFHLHGITPILVFVASIAMGYRCI